MDYCTLFPEGWWAHCCEVHDADYVLQVGQALADWDLFACVASSAPDGFMGWLAVASVPIAALMFLGVRLFGSRFYRAAGS